MYVVLGHPGAAPVSGADVLRFWGLLPEEVRGLVRFVAYGAVAGGEAAGQTLARWLGVPVGVVAGVPVGGAGAGAGVRVRTVREDGSLGWEPFAAEVLYCPAGPGEVAPEPTVLGWRPPVAGLAVARAGGVRVRAGHRGGGGAERGVAACGGAAPGPAAARAAACGR